MRDDIRGRKAPAWLQRLLTRRYGRNPYGEPRYRLVWAPSRYERSGGLWVDWAAHVAAPERLPDSPEHARKNSPATPVRRRAELRWVQKYPGEECWLIERWLPAWAYGTPELWYSPASYGGTMLWLGDEYLPGCGAYPERGEYEDIGARMYWFPTERHLVTAVDAVERQAECAPSSGYARALLRTQRAEREQQKRDEEYEQFCRDVLDDAGQAFGGARMIGYGGTRRHSSVELCERLAIREHPF